MSGRDRQTVAIIGAGRLGGAVGRLLHKAGYPVVAVTSRSRRSAAVAARFIGAGRPMTDVVKAAAGAAIVFIATPDRAIRAVCERIAHGGGLHPGALAVHASGAGTRELLAAARDAGALRAVLHPLQSIPSREQGVENLPGCFFRIEADPGALRRARQLVGALGGVEFSLPKWRSNAQSAALYHAGAVAASNYLVALVAYAVKFFQKLGADREQALQAVLPLVRGTLTSLERLALPGALTGPIARGDVQTIAGHIAAMRMRAPELLELYRLLAQQTMLLAREQGGLTDQAAEEMRHILGQ